MKRVLFLTSIAAPYRIQFFDELGKYMDVTVLFSDRKDAQHQRSAEWYGGGTGRFRQICLEKKLLSTGVGDLRTDVIHWLKQKWDAIVICGYSSPTAMLAIFYLRMRGIPFCMEVDGGLIREDSGPRFLLKKALISSAARWISSGACTTRYLVHYGAKEAAVEEYPFTSLMEADLADHIPTREEKNAARKALGLPEEHMVLAVGQFIPRKGFDILLKAAADLPGHVGICFVGGLPTEEYLTMQKELGLDHVHFVGFKKKEELRRYYEAADLFVLPTREDIWGLVINEAMACGLPVITTDSCVAGLELVEDGVNGWIIPAEDEKALGQKIRAVLEGDPESMGRASLERIRPYTIEHMAKRHLEILG